MKVSVVTKVKLNDDVIEKLEGQARTVALYKTAQWILGEVQSSGKVPKDTGALELSAFVMEVSDVVASIVFDTPYARRWYFNTEGVNFRKEYNKDAQDHWMDDFIHGDRRKEITEKYAAFYIEELGGLLT